MTRVLLLGPNGQLGSDIQRVFMDEGTDFRIEPCGRDQLDVEHTDAIRSVLHGQDFDILINCTSYHKTDEVEDNSAKAVAVNAHAVGEMAKACSEKEARFVHISTDYVFRGDLDRPYTENDTPAPINVYGATKYLGETLAFRENQDTLMLRVASLFGVSGASGKGGNFVETMLRLAREHGKLRVVDDIRMSPTSTKSVAKALSQLLVNEAPAGVYHAVNSGNATWYEFASEIIRQVGLDIPVHPVPSSEFPSRAPRPQYSVLSNAKLAASATQPDHWSQSLKDYLADKGHI